jgi:uncharacterized membrane protein
VERSIDIASPQREVFEFVADHGNVLEFMHNVRRFEPAGNKHYGLGARFYWETVVKGVRVGWQFVVTEFEPYQWMAARSLALPRSTSSWRFQRVSGGTRAIFAVTLEPPIGLLPGWIGKRFVEREVAANVERSLLNLRARLESASPAARLASA